MSNLIPTPRADKNGKIVVRHLKQDNTSTNSQLSSQGPLPLGVVKSGSVKRPQGPLPLGVVKTGSSQKPQGTPPLGVVKVGSSQKPQGPAPLGVVKIGSTKRPQGPAPLGVVKMGGKEVDTADDSFSSVSRDELSLISNPVTRMLHTRKRSRITKDMCKDLFAHGREVHRYTDQQRFQKDMGYVLALKEVEAAHGITRRVTRRSVPDELADKDRNAIISAILRPTSDPDCGKRILRLESQKNWIESHPGDVGLMIQVNDHMGYDDDTVVTDRADIDAYIELLDHDFFHGDDLTRTALRTQGFYTNDELTQTMRRAFLISAAARPELSDRIGAYIMLTRGPCDEAGFKEYLKTAPSLAGGAL